MFKIESQEFVQFGIFCAPIDLLLNGIISRLQGYDMRRLATAESIRFELGGGGAFLGGNKFDVAASSINLLQTNNKACSLYTCDLQDGWYSLFQGTSADLKCDAIWVRSSAERVRRDQYVQNFEIYRHGKLARMVNLYWDRKWVFFEKGEVLPEESPCDYNNINVKRRLKREDLSYILHEFCPAFEVKEGAEGFKITFETFRD